MSTDVADEFYLLNLSVTGLRLESVSLMRRRRAAALPLPGKRRALAVGRSRGQTFLFPFGGPRTPLFVRIVKPEAVRDAAVRLVI
jgi:hypothetical protein